MPDTSQVFGVAAQVNNYSYVDRDNLDQKLNRVLLRQTHIAIKGPSKCGKSWLRQKCLTDAIIIQCRLDMEPEDIYCQALFTLHIPFNLQRSSTTTITAMGSGDGKIKIPIVGEAGLKGELSTKHEHSYEIDMDFSSSVENLEFVANSIKRSGKRLGLV